MVFEHYGIRIICVKVAWDPGSQYWGFVQTEEHEVVSMAALEDKMRGAAAGMLAVDRTFLARPLSTDSALVRSFEQAVAVVTQTPDHPHEDVLAFAEMALLRDTALQETDASAKTGPTSWVSVWHQAEDLIRDELWARVRPVAEELRRSRRDFTHDDVARIASAVRDGIYYPHVRDEHSDIWQRWCNDQRRFNALSHSTLRKVDGTLLRDGKDVIDI